MSLDKFSLNGKVALVTGAGQGIGRAIAIGLAGAGADVAVIDLPSNQNAARDVQKEIKALNRSARVYTVDVRDLPGIRRVIDATASDFGALHILVNNAGVQIRKSAMETTEDEWDSVLDVNLKGMFFCAQAAARHMMAQRDGRIINIASLLGITTMPNRAPYCASKGGVINLTRALAVEWACDGITVNAIGPGPTDTPMTRSSSMAGDDPQLLSRSPLGRRLTADEMAGAAIYLASEAASGVNGHTIMVDGGWTAW